MNELRIDINGSTRGFQIATEDTKRLARDLQRSMDTYTPETFKGAQMSKEKYGGRFEEHGEHVSKLKEGISDLRSEISGAAGQLAAGFIGEEAIRRTIEFGEQVEILSKRTGTSTDTVQKWGYALKMSGSDMSALGPFFTKLATTRDAALGGNAKAIASFRALGVSMDELKTKRLEDIGMTISKAFEGGDAQKLIGSLREVGGRGAGEFVAAFKNGFEDLTEEATALGIVIDKQTIGKLAEAGEKWKQIGSQLMAGFAPIVSWLADAFMAIYNVVGRIAAFAGGFSAGGLKGGARAVVDYNANLDDQEEKRKKRNSGPGMSGDTADAVSEGLAKTKGLEAAQRAYNDELERSANTAMRLAMQLRDADDLQAALKAAQAAKDEVEVLKIKTEILKKNMDIEHSRQEMAKDDIEKLKHAISTAEHDGNTEAAKKLKAELYKKTGEGDEKRKSTSSHHIDALSSAGLFQSLGAVMNPKLDVEREQLHELKAIRTAIGSKKDPFHA